MGGETNQPIDGNGTGADDERAIRDAAPLLVVPDGRSENSSRRLATERPVSITYNGQAYAVMLASPADLEDFAVGFSLSEGIVANPEEIIALVDDETDDGLLLHMEIPPERMEALETRPRTLPGQSGCGLCGISELEAAARLYPAIETEPAISPDAIFAALDALPAEQKYNQATGAVHAAAFADRAGEILAVREDIGRHNALDKLVGYLRTGDFDPTSGWALLTSRCSIELTQKVMAARIPALVTISAPTGLAVEFAEAHALTLIALARSDGLLVFNDPFGKFA